MTSDEMFELAAEKAWNLAERSNLLFDLLLNHARSEDSPEDYAIIRGMLDRHLAEALRAAAVVGWLDGLELRVIGEGQVGEIAKVSHDKSGAATVHVLKEEAVHGVQEVPLEKMISRIVQSDLHLCQPIASCTTDTSTVRTLKAKADTWDRAFAA